MYTDSDSSSEFRAQCQADVDERKAYRESKEDHVRQLIENGEPIPPTILWGAVYWRRPEVVDLLMTAGVDPNRRHAKAEEIMSKGEADWLDREPDRVPSGDYGAAFPLHLAARQYCSENNQQKAYRTIGSLLRHGADPYAVFTSELYDGPSVGDARPLFPGQEICEPPVSLGDWETIFGLRSVIHAILEEGSLFRPFLESADFMKALQLEHRDPQGRTLFLSACRNTKGADEPLGKVPHQSGHRAAFPAGIYSESSTKGAQPRTAIQALLNLGADPLVTDNQGKNALHQLLEAHEMGDDCEPPVIHQSLRYLIARFPSLVNQPDHKGLAPIHTALRRMWQYSTSTEQDYVDFTPPEDCVLDLIEAGANVHARDAQGNTVIHYLADGFLDAYNGGERRRQLFYTLIDKHQCAAYINSTNALGLTPIQLMLSYTERKNEGHSTEWDRFWDKSPNMQPIDEELFGKFDELGTDWMVRDKLGRTLLHGVAQTEDWGARAPWRCRYLVQKGIDPMARDSEGKTARDLAPDNQHGAVLNFLKEAEQIAAQSKA
ncbi:ankyrin repeat-containing domain protein [Trichoderma barbatum]